MFEIEEEGIFYLVWAINRFVFVFVFVFVVLSHFSFLRGHGFLPKKKMVW